MPDPHCKECGQLLPAEPAWTVDRALDWLIGNCHGRYEAPVEETKEGQALALLREHIAQQPKPLTREALDLLCHMEVEQGWRWLVENGYAREDDG